MAAVVAAVVVVVAGSLVLATAAVLNQQVAKEPLLVLESTAVAEVSKCNTIIGVLHQCGPDFAQTGAWCRQVHQPDGSHRSFEGEDSHSSGT